jgi:hypothetical protein
MNEPMSEWVRSKEFEETCMELAKKIYGSVNLREYHPYVVNTVLTALLADTCKACNSPWDFFDFTIQDLIKIRDSYEKTSQ